MADERVSVVIPTHDRPEAVRGAVASALAQEDVAVEVIVVDDGSSPPFEAREAGVTVVRREVAGGPCAARNTGIEAATGTWILFLDDDDRLKPSMLRTALDAAAASDLPRPVAVLTGIVLVDGKGEVLARRIPVRLAKGSHYFLHGPVTGRSYQTHNSLVAPAGVVRAIGGWDERMWGTEHDDFFLRLNAACSIEAVEEPLYLMQVHEGPRRSKDLLARATAMELTVGKHPEAFRRHPERYARYLGTMGITYLRAGRWKDAVVGTWRAVQVHPSGLRNWMRFAAALAGPRVWRGMSRMRRRAGS